MITCPARRQAGRSLPTDGALWWHGFISMLPMLVIMLIVGGPRIHIAELQRKNLEFRSES